MATSKFLFLNIGNHTLQAFAPPRFDSIKASGYGRELSVLGIREFVNAKTVWIK